MITGHKIKNVEEFLSTIAGIVEYEVIHRRGSKKHPQYETNKHQGLLVKPMENKISNKGNRYREAIISNIPATVQYYLAEDIYIIDIYDLQFLQENYKILPLDDKTKTELTFQFDLAKTSAFQKELANNQRLAEIENNKKENPVGTQKDLSVYMNSFDDREGPVEDLTGVTLYLSQCVELCRIGQEKEIGLFQRKNDFFMVKQPYASCEACDNYHGYAINTYEWLRNILSQLLCFKSQEDLQKAIDGQYSDESGYVHKLVL